MNYTIAYNKELNTVVVKIAGSLTINDMVFTLEETVKILQANLNANILIDMTKASGTSLMTEHIEKLADTFKRHRDVFTGRKYANVTKSQLGFGLVRQWESFLGNHIHMEHKTFDSVNDAHTWLLDSQIDKGKYLPH